MTSAVAGLNIGSDAAPSCGGFHSEPMRLRITAGDPEPALSLAALQILVQAAGLVHGWLLTLASLSYRVDGTFQRIPAECIWPAG